MAIRKAEKEFHRRTAANCFNRAWDYLEMKNRSAKDDSAMLNLSHASRYHWSLVGTPRNQAVGDWQLSRIYSELGLSGLALFFAKSSLSICKKEHLTEIEVTANEAIARSYAVAKEYDKARQYLRKARRQLGGLAIDKEDRAIFAGQIKDTASLIK